MQDKEKNIIITILFVTILLTAFILNIIKEDSQISIVERRKLATFPDLSFDNIIDGSLSKEFEDYALDQFICRDEFRNIKSLWSNYIFRKKDNNGIFVKENAIYKIEYPLNAANVLKNTKKIDDICNKYLKGKKTYFCIIPDKNYYLDEDILKIDVSEMQNMVKKELPYMNYIDICNELTLKDYYRTDLHLKEENLLKAVNKIKEEMNLDIDKNANYDIEELGDFYGVYYGKQSKKLIPDKINILTNNTIKNSVTYNYETSEKSPVYNKYKFQTSLDKYDVYLSGATPLITIENLDSSNDKELILFRDSFGSSIAPLLIENYSKITLVDLRYISSKILDNYIDFNNQDVLFLYSTLILNQNVLK